jgi:hypothetical protein
MTVFYADRPGLASGEIAKSRNPCVDCPLQRPSSRNFESRRLLSGEERARAAQFAFEHDRVRFIQTHGIVRRIADYCGADGDGNTVGARRHISPRNRRYARTATRTKLLPSAFV